MELLTGKAKEDFIRHSINQFKSVHFPEQCDKPTYEELVEALNIFVDKDMLSVAGDEIAKQLLERIQP